MDWGNQPLPYRLYDGAEKIKLPFMQGNKRLEVDKQPDDINLNAIAAMLELSLGLSAWKQYGDSEWALRINPSSGNLHPTECYLLLPELDQQSACGAHYNPYIHSLEKRAAFPSEHLKWFNNSSGFALILTSIAWRESWKYGERAFRYCQHDLGHALAALAFACNLNGWKIQLLDEVAPEQLGKLLDLKQLAGETEYVDCICWVSTIDIQAEQVIQWLNQLPRLKSPYQPNQLSSEYQDWPIINQVWQASQAQSVKHRAAENNKQAAQLVFSNAFSSEKIIRQRRSAQSFDRRLSQCDFNGFLQTLQQTLPSNSSPFSLFCYPAHVHLVIFVHAVKGLASGLYFWLRQPSHLKDLKKQMHSDFEWLQVQDKEPLYCLKKGDFRATSETISCNQNIASDSAYSLAMLAQFADLLTADPSNYPRLYWETGLIGQVLYLQAEERGLRGTGIGCFFDDQMHQLLGLTNDKWQDLYHFTVGYPIEDKRLQTKPAYFYLQQ
jgi:SagB-type dehydrogenase family enzyme